MGTSVNIILKDVPKGEFNRNPKKDQVQYDYPSYDLVDFTKKFCVSKKWWKYCPLGPENESDLTSSHWANHSKKLLERELIDLKPLNSADNQLHTLYNNHAYKHGDKAFLLFYNNKKKFVSGCINEVSRSNIKKK